MIQTDILEVIQEDTCGKGIDILDWVRALLHVIAVMWLTVTSPELFNVVRGNFY